MVALAMVALMGPVQDARPPARRAAGLAVVNGWYTHGGRVVWGYAQHNGWWRAGQRPNLARNAPGEVGPNRTEDLPKLVEAMLRYGYPGFEHNFGLWFDRRRDAHDTARRTDDRAVPPFLEQPWARTGPGAAWDGLPKYDLERFNDWYYQRLRAFADLCDRHGAVLFHHTYMQHALLETNAHYVDFPWRPANCLQPTGLPDSTPAANALYDVSHPVRRALHRAAIRKGLDELGGHTNVVFLCSQEYTGPLAFMQFWMDTVAEWERERGRRAHLGLSATKDVTDAILRDPVRGPRVGTVDLRYWCYQHDGTLFAPEGGREVPGRYAGTPLVEATTPEQLYRQVAEYRKLYPNKALLHGLPGSLEQAWALLMGGASMLVGQLPYPELADPKEYIAPERCVAILPTYRFLRERLGTSLPRMRPDAIAGAGRGSAWALSDGVSTVLACALAGGDLTLDLSGLRGRLRALWFEPATGRTLAAGEVTGGARRAFTTPSAGLWALLVERSGGPSRPPRPRSRP